MEITWFEFLLFSVATFRLTRLLVFDTITEWIRMPFMDERKEKNADGEVEIYYVPKENGVLGWIGALISCYWCTGIWVSLGLFILRIYLPVFYHSMILIFAIAGLAALLETWVHSKKLW